MGIDGNRLLDIRDSNIRLARLVSNDAKQVQSVGLVRIYLKDLPVELFRLGILAGSMIVHRQRKCFCNSGHVLIIEDQSMVVNFQFSVFRHALRSEDFASRLTSEN